MTYEEISARYNTLYDELKRIISSTNERIIASNPDTIFIDNVNFFVKAYMTSICTYLEASLQETVFLHASEISSRAAEAKIPRNYAYWVIKKGDKDKKQEFADLDLAVDKEELIRDLSGNPGKTINLFKIVGVDITTKEGFKSNKDIVGTIVDKRNNIIHHNDNANDISFLDLIDHIDSVKKYMGAIIDSAKDNITTE